MKIPIIVSTYDRKQNYLRKTLSSMFDQSPEVVSSQLTLSVSGDSDGFLEGLPRASALLHSKEEWKTIGAMHPIDRATVNMARALAEADHTGPILYFQDDLKFASDWHKKTIAAVQFMRQKFAERFVLSLYCPFPYVKADDVEGFYDAGDKSEYRVETDDPASFYCPVRFYGNQAFFFPPRTLAEISNYMLYRLSIKQYEPDDMMLRRFLLTTQTPLYAVNPNVVQHVGLKSTGCAGHFHQSPTFKSAS